MHLAENIARRFPEDRVRRHTAPEVNQCINDQLRQRIVSYAHADRETLSRRIAELDLEWDMERTLEANAATLALTGTLLGAFVSKKFLVLPIIVTSFLLQHAIEGWCPPLPIFRRLGVRTRHEIEKERYALKLLRGDFDDTTGISESRDVNGLLQAIDR
jgi:hypothetical protein